MKDSTLDVNSTVIFISPVNRLHGVMVSPRVAFSLQ